ncbi:hypothetical protein FI667_g12377, partial [Globisporangium splendens]
MNAYIMLAPSTHAAQNYFSRCDNPRVIKRCGELHRFCEERRSRANLNQRKLEGRRRHVQIQQEQQSLGSYMAQLDQQYGISDAYAAQFDTHQQPADLLLDLDLDEDDLRVLAAILSVDSAME